MIRPQITPSPRSPASSQPIIHPHLLEQDLGLFQEFQASSVRPDPGLFRQAQTWPSPDSTYHESDHVLNLAYNVIAEGTRLEDIELRRRDEALDGCLGG